MFVLKALGAILVFILIAGVAYAVVLVGWLIAIGAITLFIIWVVVDHVKAKQANKTKAP